MEVKSHSLSKLLNSSVRKVFAPESSMPSLELFEQQPQQYQNGVLPPIVKARVVVEQASTLGWERYAGTEGAILGMKTFGASAPLKVLQKEFGFTEQNIIAAAKSQIKKNRPS